MSMLEGIEVIKPGDIEKRSFEIITGILGKRSFPAMHEPIIKRVIHTTADFEYADSLKIREDAVEKALEAIKNGGNIVTDTKMAAAGINKKSLGRFGGQVVCHMDDERIAVEAVAQGVTRAALCMEKAVLDPKNRIFAIGNAPTALLRLCELIDAEAVVPALVIGVPVGFVNVVESKELLKKRNVPFIISEGRKGGSNVAAAIVNALLYMLGRE
jgi:precorrin-8X/cobalt-precorrin-8 methylmutase